MESLKETLLNLDTMIIVMVILGAFIAYEIYSGNAPLKWFGSIRRESNPVFYWLLILFHLAVLGVVIYAWMDGVRLPLSNLFE